MEILRSTLFRDFKFLCFAQGSENPEMLRMTAIKIRLTEYQGRKGLVAISGQQQTPRVGAKAPTLGKRAEQVVELGSIGFQRSRGRWTGYSLSHGSTFAHHALHHPCHG